MPQRKRRYFTVESAITSILREVYGELHPGILFDRRLCSTDNLSYIRLIALKGFGKKSLHRHAMVE